MKIKFLGIACVALATIAAGEARAQSRSGYFLDSYSYNYQLNPAMSVDRKADFSFPGLGNLNVGVNGNVGLKNFIYNRNGKTVTFLHPDVSAAEAMDNIKTNNRLGASAREGIMSVGFRALGGYNHVSLNTVANVQARVPRDLFSFVKEGVSNRVYDIGNVDARADAYAELAFQHSHSLDKLVEGLTVGAAVKLLVGVGGADINLRHAEANLGYDQWTASTEGVAYLSVKNASWKTKVGDDGATLVDGVNLDNFSAPSGYGVAFDLGATYKFGSDFTFGLAFTDIGFISWSNTITASTNGTHTFNSNNHVLDPDDFDSSWDKMRDDLEELYRLQAHDGTSSRCRALEATMNASVEYQLPVYRQVSFRLPMYKKLSFGLLNSTRIASRFAWTDFRLSANYQPVKWIGVAVNYGVGTFGDSFGWIVNIAPKGFNLFVGMDHTLGKLSKEYIPLGSNAQFSFGINFPL